MEENTFVNRFKKWIELNKENLNEDGNGIDLDISSMSDVNDVFVELISRELDCKVRDNYIFQLADDFEVYLNHSGEGTPVDRGIWEIYKIDAPNFIVIPVKQDLSVIKDVDGIDSKPIDNYIGDEDYYTLPLKDAPYYFNKTFGNNWLFTNEENESEYEEALNAYDLD